MVSPLSEKLHAEILEVNAAKNLVRWPPTLERVKNRVKQAKSLPRKVEY